MIKPGVRLQGLQAPMAIAYLVCLEVFRGHDVLPCVITSGTDGDHKAGSLHHCGLALDIRSRHLDPRQSRAVVASLANALGPEFDVVAESTHIHVEYDP